MHPKIQQAERRTFQVKTETRSEGGELFVGRAVVYNEWSGLIYGCFQERIAPGAFDDCLDANPDILATVNHDMARVIGRTSAKTLKLIRDDDGIGVEVTRGDYSYARDLATALDRGDISGMSFTFSCLRDSWTMENDVSCRTVVKADIYEVGFVFTPAYDQTEAGMRSNPTEGEQRAIAAAKAFRDNVPGYPLSLLRARLRLAEIAAQS